jgi:hypothetical protein
VSETPRQKQSRFAKMVPRLIDKAHALGFEVTLGDAYRDPKVHGNMGERKSYSHPYSTHKVRLAIDLNLFRKGEYLEGSEAHRPLGEWWEKQGPDHRWGGRFGDGNHYSFAHVVDGIERK